MLSLVGLLLGWLCLVPVTAYGQAEAPSETAIVIHGGAGSMSADDMSREKQETYRAALRTALQEGNEVLQNGGSALDAVEAAITTIEEIEELGGVGGVIALDPEGNIATPFSTSGMFRASVDTEGETTVRIFGRDGEK